MFAQTPLSFVIRQISGMHGGDVGVGSLHPIFLCMQVDLPCTHRTMVSEEEEEECFNFT